MILEPDFLDHWKTQLLRDKLGGDVAVVVLVRLWTHCQQRRAFVFPFTADTLKAICRFPGKGDDLLSSLVNAGFLDPVDGQAGQFKVHDWDVSNASLIANWQNGKSGGRPRKCKTNTKPTDHPVNIPMNTHGLSVGHPIDREDREEREEGEDGESANDSTSTHFPPDGIPTRIANLIRLKCPELSSSITPASITSGAWLVSAYQSMPFEAWQQAAEELCAYVNANGYDASRGQTPSGLFTRYVRTAHANWLRFQTSPTLGPKKNGAAGQDADILAGKTYAGT